MSSSRVCLFPRHILHHTRWRVHTSNRDDNSVPEWCQRLCVRFSSPTSPALRGTQVEHTLGTGILTRFPFPVIKTGKERLTHRLIRLLWNPYPLGQQGFHLSLLLLPSRSVPDHCSTRIHIQASTPKCPQLPPTRRHIEYIYIHCDDGRESEICRRFSAIHFRV